MPPTSCRAVYDRTGGGDGYVSVEVSPDVAHDTDATVAEAHRLWRAVGRPNLMIKVPGTAAGVPAVRALIADGVNVNITLLFGQRDVRGGRLGATSKAWRPAFLGRARTGGIDRMASVASFFVSRIDTKRRRAARRED